MNIKFNFICLLLSIILLLMDFVNTILTLITTNGHRLGLFTIYIGFIQSIFIQLKKYIRTRDDFYLLPDERKDYVLKNIFKSFVLFFFIPMATYILYVFVTENRHDTWTVIIAGWIYSACDIVGLINVKLPTTTLIHHCIVTVFAIMATLMNHTVFTFFTPIILYAAICSYTFSVNLFLGVRFLYPEAKFTYYLCRMSYWVYAIAVASIISMCMYCFYQMLFVSHPITIVVMVSLITMLWRDDFILLGWLRKYYRNTPYYLKNKL